MKTLLPCLFFLLIATAGQALPTTTVHNIVTIPIAIPAGGYEVSFGVQWTADGEPRASTAGRIELRNGAGTLVGRLVADHTQAGGNQVSADVGAVTGVQSWIANYAWDGRPADGTLVGQWHLSGLPAGNYTLRFYEYQTELRLAFSTTIWTETHWIDGTAITGTAPTIAWTSAPATAGSAESYSIVAHGQDSDGDLAQVTVWKNSQLFALAGGGTGAASDAGNQTSDSGPQVVTFTAQATDGMGNLSAVISHAVTIAAPAVHYALVTTAGAGGSVSPGGTFPAGTFVSVTASPDASHDFVGWSGHAAGIANPLSVVLDADKTIQANFTPRACILATSASAGGSVTPGGIYPYGSSVTVTASANGSHRFSGWAGDASGSTPSLLLTLTRSLAVQALFAMKSAQTITFTPPADQPIGGPALMLDATASSGLPVSYRILSGPAVVSGNELALTGPGAVTVEAFQPGDADYLPAIPLARTFNAVTGGAIHYQRSTRTWLQSGHASAGTSFVLEQP